ncbi:MAG: hypothetical protein AAB373_03655 [Patescibacteria group bacterium]
MAERVGEVLGERFISGVRLPADFDMASVNSKPGVESLVPLINMRDIAEEDLREALEAVGKDPGLVDGVAWLVCAEVDKLLMGVSRVAGVVDVFKDVAAEYAKQQGFDGLTAPQPGFRQASPDFDGSRVKPILKDTDGRSKIDIVKSFATLGFHEATLEIARRKVEAQRKTS